MKDIFLDLENDRLFDDETLDFLSPALPSDEWKELSFDDNTNDLFSAELEALEHSMKEMPSHDLPLGVTIQAPDVIQLKDKLTAVEETNLAEIRSHADWLEIKSASKTGFRQKMICLVGAAATLFSAVTGCVRHSQDPLTKLLRDLQKRPDKITSLDQYYGIAHYALPQHETKIRSLLNKVRDTDNHDFTSMMLLKADIDELMRLGKNPIEHNDLRLCRDTLTGYHTHSNYQLVNEIIEPIIKTPRNLDTEVLQNALVTLTSHSPLQKTSSHSKNIFLQSLKDIFAQALPPSDDILPIDLNGTEFITTKFELERRLVEAIGSKDFERQQEIVSAINNNIVKHRMDYAFKHAETLNADEKEFINLDHFKKAYQSRLEHTENVVRDVISKGLKGTLFGADNKKRSIILFDHVGDYPNSTPGFHYDFKTLREHQLLYDMSKQGNNNMARYEVIERPTEKTEKPLDYFRAPFKRLSQEFEELKRLNMPEKIDNEIMVVLHGHGLTHYDSFEHMVSTFDGVTRLSKIKDIITEELLKNHKEVEKVIIVAENCRSIIDKSLGKFKPFNDADPRIEVLFGNQVGHVTIGAHLGESIAHENLTAFYLQRLMSKDAQETFELYPTLEKNIREAVTINHMLSSMKSLTNKVQFDRREYEYQYGNGASKHYYPYQGKQREEIEKKLNQMLKEAREDVKNMEGE